MRGLILSNRFLKLALSNVLYRPFVKKQAAVGVVHGSRVFRDPDNRSVAAVGLGFKISYLTFLFHLLQKTQASFRLNVKQTDGIRFCEKLFGRIVSEHAGHGGVDCNEPAGSRGLVNALNGVFKYAAIATFCLPVDGFRFFLGGRVLNMAGNERYPRIRTLKCRAPFNHPAILPVSMLDAIFDDVAITLVERPKCMFPNRFAIARMNQVLEAGAPYQFMGLIARQFFTSCADILHSPMFVSASAIDQPREAIYKGLR